MRITVTLLPHQLRPYGTRGTPAKQAAMQHRMRTAARNNHTPTHAFRRGRQHGRF